MEYYKPTINDFDLIQSYSPTKKDFEFANEIQPIQQQNAMDMARQQTMQTNPQIPNWLRSALLNLSEQSVKHPGINKIQQALSPSAGFIERETAGTGVPSAIGGFLEGASYPIRGVGGLLPGKIGEYFKQDPKFTEMPVNQTNPFLQKTAQLGGELIGGGMAFNPLFKEAQSLTKLAPQAPKLLQNIIAGGASGYAGSPDHREIGAAIGAGLPIADKILEKTMTLPKMIQTLYKQQSPEKAVSAAQGRHDLWHEQANKLYGEVEQGIEKNNITNIPIEKSIMEELPDYFPKSRKYQKLIHNAKNGDYNSVHELQSDLYKLGKKAASSDDFATANQGEEMLDLRDRINEGMEKHLRENGYHEIADMLNLARDKFRKLKQTYYSNPTIAKMVQPGLRKVPKNPLSTFNEDSEPMKRFIEEHPEIKAEIELSKNKELIQKKLKNYGISGVLGTGSFGGTLAGAKIIKDWLAPKQHNSYED